MTTHLLLHGAGSDGWYWHRVLPLLPAAVAPDLPVTDDEAGLEEYADAAAAAVDGPVVVVAQSLAGFVAPLLRDPDAEFDPVVTFLHDVPAELVAEGWPHVFPQSSRPFHDPWPLDHWPDVPTRFLAGTQDRLFPLPFQERVVRERLGLESELIDCGHLPALARPAELAAWLVH
jgi:pimeloyl-ACP methyl ester carboxylesterase